MISLIRRMAQHDSSRELLLGKWLTSRKSNALLEQERLEQIEELGEQTEDNCPLSSIALLDVAQKSEDGADLGAVRQVSAGCGQIPTKVANIALFKSAT